MKLELYFRLSDMAGFTASKLADQQQGFAIPIRELMQNSLDASREAKNDKCEVNIYIGSVNKDQIPCIAEYRKVLEKAIKTQKAIGSYQNQQKQVVEKIMESLSQETIPIMTFTDNGAGLTPEKLEALLSERSLKDSNDSSGGSYGVGHLSAYSLSSLRYILYTSRYKDSAGKINTLFTGSPILAGYMDTDQSQRGAVGRIVASPPTDEKNPRYDYPVQPPSFLKDKVNDFQSTGTIVSILGLSEEWGNEAEYAIASHFFHALAYESLTVTIQRQNEAPTSMSKVMHQRLSEKRTEKTAKIARGFILSGQAVWQSYQAVSEGNYLKTISLSNDDDVDVYIKTTPDVTESSVALIRSDMLIARHDSMISPDFERLRKNSDFSPFALVIDVVDRKAPTLFSLIKKAEGPHHNKLVPNNLLKKDVHELRKLLGELSNKTEHYLKKIDRDTFNLPLFSIPNKATENSPYGNQISSNVKTAQPVKPRGQSPKRRATQEDQQKRKNGKKFMPTIVSRRLESQISARYEDDKEVLVAKLYIVPNSEDTRDITWLSFCLGEDMDKNSGTLVWLELASITMNDQMIEIDSENKQIAILGQMRKGETYNISAHLHRPEKQADRLKYALQPVLGLRRR